jgi:hypothetical protein
LLSRVNLTIQFLDALLFSTIKSLSLSPTLIYEIPESIGSLMSVIVTLTFALTLLFPL